MAVKIRLARTGKTGKASYRVVAIDGRQKRNGKVLETLGMYDPTPATSIVNVDMTRVKYWLSKGAQLSESVGKLLHL